MHMRIGTLDVAVADALRANDGDATGKTWPGMQRSAEPFRCRRGDVILQVRRVLRGIAAREGAKLRRLRAHRPALGQQIICAHTVAPQRVLHPLIHGDGVLHLEAGADLPVVLHVLADAGSSCCTGMPCCASNGAGPMPDSSSSCGEPIAPAARGFRPRACAYFNSSPCQNSIPTARLPSRRIYFGMGIGENTQVGPGHRRVQKRLGGGPAPTIADSALEISRRPRCRRRCGHRSPGFRSRSRRCFQASTISQRWRFSWTQSSPSAPWLSLAPRGYFSMLLK